MDDETLDGVTESFFDLKLEVRHISGGKLKAVILYRVYDTSMYQKMVQTLTLHNAGGVWTVHRLQNRFLIKKQTASNKYFIKENCFYP